MHISIKNMERYKETARARAENEKKQLTDRYHRAREIAKKGAELLKKESNVKEVILFGSLVRKELFHMKSDIDLAVKGLDERVYYRIVSRLLDLDTDIQVDLLMIENAAKSLKKRIKDEGVVI